MLLMHIYDIVHVHLQTCTLYVLPSRNFHYCNTILNAHMHNIPTFYGLYARTIIIIVNNL